MLPYASREHDIKLLAANCETVNYKYHFLHFTAGNNNQSKINRVNQ